MAANAQTFWDGETDSNFSTFTNWSGDIGPSVGGWAQVNNNGINAPIVGANQTYNILGLEGGTLTIDNPYTLVITSLTDVGGGTLTGWERSRPAHLTGLAAR